jgi:hypothetical protein
MKKLLFLTLFFTFTLGTTSAFIDQARAQVPGAVISATAIGGGQTSSLSGVGSVGFGTNDFFAVRGSFMTFFLEYRHVDWGKSNDFVRENGILGGADFTLFHIMVSGAIGFGASTAQGPSIPNSISTNLSSYSSLAYDAQAQYQFEIVPEVLSLGIGVNYIGESNGVAPITGWGGIASLNFGL